MHRMKNSYIFKQICIMCFITSISDDTWMIHHWQAILSLCYCVAQANMLHNIHLLLAVLFCAIVLHFQSNVHISIICNGDSVKLQDLDYNESRTSNLFGKTEKYQQEQWKQIQLFSSISVLTNKSYPSHSICLTFAVIRPSIWRRSRSTRYLLSCVSSGCSHM